MYRSGIYQIRNKVNGKLYIGSSCQLKKRKYEHFRNLKNGNHDNCYLQNSFNKHGIDNFIFETLFFCDKEDGLFYEQRTINFYGVKCLYNINSIAINPPSRKGVKHTQEWKNNMSQMMKGRKRPENEIKRGEENPFFGMKHSEETRKKMSKIQSNRKKEPHKGHKHSAEAKKKMSLAHTNRDVSGYNRENVRRGKDHPNARSIYALLDGEIVEKFNCIADAARHLNVSPQSISNILTGCVKKTRHGYTFKYAEAT